MVTRLQADDRVTLLTRRGHERDGLLFAARSFRREDFDSIASARGDW